MEVIILNVTAFITIVVLAVWLSAWYWRSQMRQSEDVQRLKMMEMRFGLDRELKEEQRRQSELEFNQKKERLESNMQTRRALNKVELAYNVMHDVQAVHQGVDGYLRMMMDPTLTPSPEDWNMMCREVKLKSNLLRDLVDSAIELMQYENLADVPMEDDVLVNQFCQDMFDACERYVKNDKIDLVFETALQDDFKVKTNMGYIRKLMKNLLICSMEYTDKGFIKLIASEDEKRHTLHFVIKDTGIGIPEHIQETVFEHLNNDEDLKNKIVNVRLRICRVLTHLLGGTISVDTHYRDGTAIAFSIRTNT